MSNFLNGLQFGFVQGMFNNMFGFGGFGNFGGFWGNPFGCYCYPSCFMSPMYMVPRYGFGFTPYITPEAQVNFPAMNIPKQNYSWNDVQSTPVFNNNNFNVTQQNYSWGSWGDTFTYSAGSTATSPSARTGSTTGTSSSTRSSSRSSGTSSSSSRMGAFTVPAPYNKCVDTVMSQNPYVPTGHQTASDMSKIPSKTIADDRPSYMTLPDGTQVIGYHNSRFSKCRPELVELLHCMLQAADQLGYTIMFGDVERTVAASNYSRNNGKPGVAKGGYSPHNYGAAVDICLYKDGHGISSHSSEFKKFAELALQLSNNKLQWGAEWDPKLESHHFQIRGWADKFFNKAEYLVG